MLLSIHDEEAMSEMEQLIATLEAHQRNENYQLMLQRYRDDLNNIASQILAVSTKIDNLEYVIKNNL